VKTDDLIQQLAAELEPVRPLPSPGKRAVLWLAGSVLYFAALAIGMSRLGGGMGGIESSLLFSQSIGVLAGVLAVIAAFASVVPGHSNRALIGAVAAALAWLGWFAVTAIGAGEAQALAASQPEWICVAVILVGGAPLAAVMAVMLKRGAPLNPALTGFLIAMAVGLLANFSACISLPHGDVGVAFAWHGGALAVLALCCVIVSRLALTWR
jgi:hypothetical protein